MFKMSSTSYVMEHCLHLKYELCCVIIKYIIGQKGMRKQYDIISLFNNY